MDWNQLHLNDETPWDLGEACAALKWFFSSTPTGAEIAQSQEIVNILVPGCGQVGKAICLLVCIHSSLYVGVRL
jgi:hypothetical protein